MRWGWRAARADRVWAESGASGKGPAVELHRLIEGLGVTVAAGDPAGRRVLDLTEDSRTAMPGSLFIARRGLKADGRRFVREAVELGAVAVLTDDAEGLDAGDAVVLVARELPETIATLAERFHGDPAQKLFAIGITGTNGKTTVAHLTHRLLNAAGVRTGLIGTVEIDDGRERAPASMTTPPALELSRTLAIMVESGCRAVAMEVSSHALDQRRADGVRFGVGVFTNLTGDHLDYHGTIDRYALAKRRLFDLVGRDGGLAVVNGHDARGAFMAEGCETGWCCREAPGDHAGWVVRVVERTGSGMRLAISGPAFETELVAPVELIGQHNAMNTLQAVVSAQRAMATLGFNAGEIRARLGRALTLLHPPTGRLEPAHGGHDDISVLIDYAHTDDALGHCLSAAREVVPPGRRLWAVFGAGGERDTTKRPRMGAVVAELADAIVVTSDNPRSESPSAIISEVVAGIPKERQGAMSVQADRERAIEHAITRADPGDVVVIAGKGHETEQLLPGPDGRVVRRPFDDRAQARAALVARRARAGFIDSADADAARGQA